MSSKKKVFNYIENFVIDKLDKGIIPWSKVWDLNKCPINSTTQKPFDTLNQILLNRSGEYGSYSYWKAKKTPVIIHEKSEYTIIYGTHQKMLKTGEIGVKEHYKFRAIFNHCQTNEKTYKRYNFRCFTLSAIIDQYNKDNNTKFDNINDIVDDCKNFLDIQLPDNIYELCLDILRYSIVNICNLKYNSMHNCDYWKNLLLTTNQSVLFECAKFVDQMFRYIVSHDDRLYSHACDIAFSPKKKNKESIKQ